LMDHSWPGNVRELDNVIQRALLMRAGDQIEVSDLAIDALPQAEPLHLASVSRIHQRRAIEDALIVTQGNRVRAAERLGVSERTLRYRLADLRAAA
jgi:two-component system, response regulator FlrC